MDSITLPRSEPLQWKGHSRPMLVWTDNLVQRLTALSDAGLSARETATLLGRGVNRNMVLGKLKRIRDKKNIL